MALGVKTISLHIVKNTATGMQAFPCAETITSHVTRNPNVLAKVLEGVARDRKKGAKAALPKHYETCLVHGSIALSTSLTFSRYSLLL